MGLDDYENADGGSALKDALISAASMQFPDAHGQTPPPLSNPKAIERRTARLAAQLRALLGDLPQEMTLDELRDEIQTLYETAPVG